MEGGHQDRAVPGAAGSRRAVILWEGQAWTLPPTQCGKARPGQCPQPSAGPQGAHTHMSLWDQRLG